MVNDVIIGAGISGLSFGYFSKKTFIIFEKEKQAGGLCRSVKDSGFTFDYSGHFIHIKDKKIKTLIECLTGKSLLTVKRNSAILFKEKTLPFPFQANLYYLNEKEKLECIKGIKNRKNRKIYNDMPFIDWCKAMFGDGITKYFMQPYNEKLWNCDLKKLTAAWTAPFVPKPSAQSIIESAYKENKNKYGYNSVFYYPSSGGCQTLTDSFYKKLKQNILTETKAENIDWQNKTVYAGKKYYQYKNLISTQPLKELLNQMQNLPKKISNLLKNLTVTSVRCVNIGVKYKKEIPQMIKDKHWIYIPDEKYSFYRVGIYSNAAPKTVPQKAYSLYVELSGKDNKYPECENIIPSLKKIGIMNHDDEVVCLNVIDIPYAYVLFDKNRYKSMKEINSFLNANAIYSIGRYGAWEYSFIEKNITDAKNLALLLNKTK